ncbi:MAG: hypothetical protein M5U34_42380 [Chloroflexi bacterium]|nr:hypothetical protein [Chloroflexota bacterium]
MYDKIAHYYDLTHADLTEDIDYILKLVGKTAVSLIELGCGSGRLCCRWLAPAITSPA